MSKWEPVQHQPKRYADTSDRFVVSRAGQVSAPVSAEQVRAWFASGMTDAYVRPESSGDWTHILQSPFANPRAVVVEAPAAPVVRERPQAQAIVPRPASARSKSPWWLSAMHAVRWCFAGFLATTLSFMIVAAICLSSPMHVLDSRQFWIDWANSSSMMRSVHQKLDEGLDAAEIQMRSGQVHAQLGSLTDTSEVARALERIRPEIHRNLQGQVIDAALGILTGRDDQLAMDVGLQQLRKSTREGFAQALTAEHCGSSVSCQMGGVALDMGVYDAIWDTLSTRLGRFNPFSAGFIANLIPGVGQSRMAFSLLRGLLAIAPYLLLGLGVSVLVTSLRLRTASFMFGVSLLCAGLATTAAASGAHVLADSIGTSPEVWDLMLKHSGAVHAGIGEHQVLLVLGATLLFTRCLGPRWRRAFWTRRLSSNDQRISLLAAQRLSRRSGLLEPVHVARHLFKA